MRIGIDTRLLSGNMTGISRYLWNVIKYIPKFDKKNKYFLYLHDDVALKNSFYNYVNVPKSKIPKQVYSHYWLNFVLPKSLEKNKIDLFYTPYILVPLRKGNCKNVIVIHDVMTKSCPQFFTNYYKKYMDIIVPQAIKRSDAIVTVSESARKDIIKYYYVKEDKVKFMHLWTDEKYKVINTDEQQKLKLQQKYNLPEKYILYVGTIEERKNIKGIMNISDILISKGIDIKFVLVGNKGFGFDNLIDEISKRSNILYLNYIDEQDLPLLYNLSFTFVFLSYYEGFGIPPLEAMKCGVPVLSANNSSLIEVVGEGGKMFDADNIDAFVDQIIMLLNDKNYYDEMKFKAVKQSQRFSAENSIPKLIELFDSLS